MWSPWAPREAETPETSLLCDQHWLESCLLAHRHDRNTAQEALKGVSHGMPMSLAGEG